MGIRECAHLSPDPDNVQHARVAQLCNDEVVIVGFGCLLIVWLQAADIPVHKQRVRERERESAEQHLRVCGPVHKL